MDISPLFDLRRRLHTAALAGAASCPGDARLARACEGLAPLEAAAPVFRKLGELVRRLCAPEGDERVAVLLEALTLADALACTQAVVSVPGEAGPVEPAVAWGGAMADVPFSVLRQVRENPLRKLNLAASFMEELMRSRGEWRCDVRLCKELLRLMDAGEDQSANLWLTEQDKNLLPLLQANFDPRGGEGMKYRVEAISKIAGAEANDFYVSHLPAAKEEIRSALLEALPPTEENAGLLVRLCRTEKEESLRAKACNLLARTPLPDRWDILRSLKESDPEMLLEAMEGLDSPEASALTVELWELILPSYEADPTDWSAYFLYKDSLIGKSWPGIHDIYRRLAAMDRIRDAERDENNPFREIDCTAETLRASILVTRDESLLELAGELAHDVSPRFAVPWLSGLLVMRSSGAAYDAARELLGPEGFGHGALSATAQRVLADVFFRAYSLAEDSIRDAMIHPFYPTDELDADCFAAAVTAHACVFRRYNPLRQHPLADALDPRWLDAMMLADPFEAYPYYPARARRGRVSQNEQRTLADLLFRLADLQDPHMRERLGAFFHEQALRGVERGYRVLLWLRCCGRSDYRGIMTAELRRKGKRHGEDISFANYYKVFLLLGEPLTFAEEGEDCLRRIRDGEIRSPAQAQVRKLEKCIAEARREASRIAGETA